MSDRGKKVVQLDDRPTPDQSKAREALERAKARAGARPSAPEIPGFFDEAQGAPPAAPRPGTSAPPPQGLRKETADGLAALGEEMRRQAAEDNEAAPPAPDDEAGDLRERLAEAMHAALEVAGITGRDRDAVVREAFRSLDQPPPPTEDEKERQRVEAEIDPLDIGTYVMSGGVEQEVPFLRAGGRTFTVTFRSTREREDEFVEKELRLFRSPGKDIEGKEIPPPTGIEVMRHQTRLALAAQIIAYNGAKWPPIRNDRGEIDEKNFDRRMDMVREFPSHVFNRLSQHAYWFNDRLHAALRNPEVLGNG